MKKILLLSFVTLFSYICLSQSKDLTLFTIGDKKISKSEFEYFWKKNNLNENAETLTKEAYLDMFITFKQKVAFAESEGIDKTIAFITEFQGYRNQLTAPYLNDSVAKMEVEQNLYNRLKYYVDVSHIFIKCKPDATPEDSLRQYLKILKCYWDIEEGKDFATIAKQFSEDSLSRINGGKIGTKIGSSFLYEFGNNAFSIPIGKVSEPFRTELGFHIIKVVRRFPTWGQFSSGHIMKAVSPNATKQAWAAAKDSIYKIYSELQKGADFTYYATNHSDDASASSNGGKYGFIDCGIFPFAYDSVVNSLKIGAFSAPFKTEFGWHIVQLLDKKPLPPFSEYESQIDAFVNENATIQKTLKNQHIHKLLNDYKFMLNPESVQKIQNAYEQKLRNNDSLQIMLLGVSNDVLYSLNGKTNPIKKFKLYADEHMASNGDISITFYDMISEEVLGLENANLEVNFPEFGQLMQEYREGMLLFEVSNREVWEKSSNDTKGLQKYYSENIKKYTWDKPHFKGVLIRCSNEAIAKKVKKQLAKISNDSIAEVLGRTFNNDSISVVRTEQGLFKIGENALIDYLAFKKSQPEADKKYPVSFLKGKVLKAPENYTDVMGQLVMDYQNWLEENWVKSLKAKYPVVIDKEVLNTVNNN
jgi:peptidyl-prolyl cis-trans isomerase SurA